MEPEKIQVISYGFDHHIGKFKYNDDSDLLLIADWGYEYDKENKSFEVVRDLDAAALYKNKMLEAVATCRSIPIGKDKHGLKYGSGFWTKGEVTQPELRIYWMTASSKQDDIKKDYENRNDKDDLIQPLYYLWKLAQGGLFEKMHLKNNELETMPKPLFIEDHL